MIPDQQTLRKLLTYDENTGELTWLPRPRSMFSEDRIFKSWNSTFANKPAFTSVDKKGYHIGAIFGKNYRANRVIYKYMTGIEPDQVDHENGNPSDDRWFNLREVDHVGNQRNMKRSKANKSGVTGVCFNKGKGKWQATIGVDGKSKVLGRFDTIQEAVACRKQAEIDYGYHRNHGR